MDVLDAIQARRSINHFDPDHAMPRAVQDELLRLARLAPSSFNLQHCRYVVVRDRELRQALRAVSFGQAQVTDASLLVAVCADLGAWRKHPERYWDHAPARVRQAMVRAIREAYEGDPQLQRDECMRSCGLAAQALMLAGQGLGYESCAMNGFVYDDVARLLNLPDDHVLAMFVALGKAREPAHPAGGRLPVDEVVFEDRFPG